VVAIESTGKEYIMEISMDRVGLNPLHIDEDENNLKDLLLRKVAAVFDGNYERRGDSRRGEERRGEERRGEERRG
jgi:hypothetical protein